MGEASEEFLLERSATFPISYLWKIHFIAKKRGSKIRENHLFDYKVDRHHKLELPQRVTEESQSPLLRLARLFVSALPSKNLSSCQ